MALMCTAGRGIRRLIDGLHSGNEEVSSRFYQILRKISIRSSGKEAMMACGFVHMLLWIANAPSISVLSLIVMLCNGSNNPDRNLPAEHDFLPCQVPNGTNDARNYIYSDLLCQDGSIANRLKSISCLDLVRNFLLGKTSLPLFNFSLGERLAGAIISSKFVESAHAWSSGPALVNYLVSTV